VISRSSAGRGSVLGGRFRPENDDPSAGTVIAGKVPRKRKPLIAVRSSHLPRGTLLDDVPADRVAKNVSGAQRRGLQSIATS